MDRLKEGPSNLLGPFHFRRPSSLSFCGLLNFGQDRPVSSRWADYVIVSKKLFLIRAGQLSPFSVGSSNLDAYPNDREFESLDKRSPFVEAGKENQYKN